MPRLSPEERLAALEKRKAAIHQQQLKLNREMRAVRSRQKSQTRKDDARRKIIAGALALEHFERNPESEFGRLLFRLLDQYARPEDRRLFSFLPVREAPPSPAPSSPDVAGEAEAAA